MNTINPVRPSPIAGSWYSADPLTLSLEISQYLAFANVPNFTDEIIGLISPHAGYVYSGRTAGYAYRLVQGSHYDLCVVVSPLHSYLPFPLLTSAHAAYATPLGTIDVARDLLDEFDRELADHSVPGLHPIAEDNEHSLEIQLPFLQSALSGTFQLLPIMVRSADHSYLQKTASILAKLIKGKNALLVASTDLSHFHTESMANSLDKVMLERMTDFSPTGVLKAEEEEKGFACGSGAVALVLWTAQSLGANKVTLLHHTTSAQATGNPFSVVGYGALAITRQRST